MLLVPARFMSQDGWFPFIIMMDIVVQKETSLAFPYCCIIAVCPAAIPTWKRSFHRHARLIIPQEFIWDVEKCSLILASYFSSGQTEWGGDFPGCYSRAVKSDVWKRTGTTKDASSHVSRGHGLAVSTSLQHFCVRCAFKCRLPTSLQTRTQVLHQFLEPKIQNSVLAFCSCVVSKFSHTDAFSLWCWSHLCIMSRL